MNATLQNKANMTVSQDNGRHEYHQVPRAPFTPGVCSSCGLTASIDGDVVVDTFVVNPGTMYQETHALCLGCLANLRLRLGKARRVEA